VRICCLRSGYKFHIFMDYLSVWESFLEINMLNCMIYILISTITPEFCLLQVCTLNSNV